MDIKNITLPVLSFILASAFTACQANSPLVLEDNPQNPLKTAIKSKVAHRITLKVDPSDFQIQNLQAAFIKLTITNGEEIIYAINADQEHFVAGTNGQVTLSANVPEGNNWVATVGFYSNKTSPPFKEFKGVFHSPHTGEVNINLNTHLLGDILTYLQELKSPVLNQAIDINNYQSFLNTLTGMEIQNGTRVYNRLTQYNPPTPLSLSGKDIAIQIHTGGLPEVTTQAAQNLNPNQFVTSPSQVGSARVQGMTQGLSRMAINSQTGHIFAKDRHISSAKLYSWSPNPNSTKMNEFFTSRFAGQEPEFYAFDGAESPVLGITNPTGNAPESAVFVAERSINQTTLVKAFNQSSGQLLWSYDYNGVTTDINYAFRPALYRDTKNTVQTTDDEDWVFHAIATNEIQAPNTTGLYAIRKSTQNQQGETLWHYATPLIQQGPQREKPIGSALLSQDKSKVYILTRNGQSIHFITINRTNGQELNRKELSFSAASEPVMGSDGTVYFQAQSNIGRLYAFNPDGTEKWSKSLPQRGFFPPVIDRVNGRDILYVISSTGLLQSYFADDQSTRWIQLVKNQTTLTPILLGLEPTGDRIIYTGIGSLNTGESKLYAIRDQGQSAKIDWEITPGGALWTGLTLKDNFVYLSTRDGGDGQFVALQAIKTSTPNMPPNAPWPKPGKNLETNGQ